MKKKISAVLTALTMATMLTACSSDYDFITLPEYKGLSLPVIQEYSVSDTEIDARINSLLASSLVSEEIVDREIKSGDLVTFDLNGTIDGKSYPNSSLPGYTYMAGSNGFAEEFDEALIGKNIGDKYTVSIDHDDNFHNSETAGKTVAYEIKISGIRSQVAPELNDEWVASTSETASTVEELRTEIEKAIEVEQVNLNATSMQTQLWSTIMATVEMGDIPSSMLKDEVSRLENQYLTMADKSGLSLVEYISVNVGMDEETFIEYNTNMAKYNIQERGTIYKIAEAENLIPSDEEYYTHFQSKLMTYGFNSVEALLENVSEDDLKTAVLSEIVKSYIVDNAIQTDAD